MSRYLIFFLSVVSFLVPTFAQAQENYSLKKLFYYVEGKRGMESFRANAKNIDIIAPQVYGVSEKGELKGKLTDEFKKIAKDNGVEIMPLVTNSGFSQKAIHNLLNDKRAQDKAIRAMIEEGKKEGYLGWQFDFEQMTADYRDKYSAFVKRAYPQFKKNDLQFSVAVIAQISENPNDYPNNLWQRVIGVYDYEELGQNVDFLSIMSYDQPASGGPVASMDWVKKVVRFAIGKVPNQKLSLGVPFYFWKWDKTTGKLVDIGGYGRVSDLFKYSKGQIINKGFDPTYQVAWVQYWQNKKIYTAWYENAQSFSRKMELAYLYKMHGFSAWVLGLEDPEIHKVIQTKQI